MNRIKPCERFSILKFFFITAAYNVQLDSLLVLLRRKKVCEDSYAVKKKCIASLEGISVITYLFHL